MLEFLPSGTVMQSPRAMIHVLHVLLLTPVLLQLRLMTASTHTLGAVSPCKSLDMCIAQEWRSRGSTPIAWTDTWFFSLGHYFIFPYSSFFFLPRYGWYCPVLSCSLLRTVYLSSPSKPCSSFLKSLWSLLLEVVLRAWGWVVPWPARFTAAATLAAWAWI